MFFQTFFGHIFMVKEYSFFLIHLVRFFEELLKKLDNKFLKFVNYCSMTVHNLNQTKSFSIKTGYKFCDKTNKQIYSKLIENLF